MRALFDAWLALIEQFGPVTVIPQKTRIAFQTRVRFAGAIVRRDLVWCTFWLKRPIARPPPLLEPPEFIPPRYHVYRFRLTDPRQLRTPGLRTLLRESYDLGWQRQGSPFAVRTKMPAPRQEQARVKPKQRSSPPPPRASSKPPSRPRGPRSSRARS